MSEDILVVVMVLGVATSAFLLKWFFEKYDASQPKSPADPPNPKE